MTQEEKSELSFELKIPHWLLAGVDIVNICNKFVMKTDRIYNLPILLLSTKATPQTSAVKSILTIVPI